MNPTITSTRAGDTLEIRFQGNQLVIDGERGPQGGRLGVLVDGTGDALHALPQDDKGWRYLDFRAETSGPATMTVVSGLDPLGAAREHRVLLKTLPATEGAAGTVTIRSVEVGYTQSSTIFLLVSAFATLAALAVLATIARLLIRVRTLRRAV